MTATPAMHNTALSTSPFLCNSPTNNQTDLTEGIGVAVVHHVEAAVHVHTHRPLLCTHTHTVVHGLLEQGRGMLRIGCMSGSPTLHSRTATGGFSQYQPFARRGLGTHTHTHGAYNDVCMCMSHA